MVGCGLWARLSSLPIDHAPMGEVRARMDCKAYPGVHTRHAYSTACPGPTTWCGWEGPRRTRPPSLGLCPPRRTPWPWVVTCLRCTCYARGWRGCEFGTSVWMSGVRLRVPLVSAYIRSLGRHALPHTYHKEDFCKLMTAARRGSAVIPLRSPRAQYPPAMYNPKASGMAQFQAGVRPPPPPS